MQVVSPYYFEVHAGSTKKHPSDYIFLENGNNLHDILRACSDATLDMLQSAIQNAIGPAPKKRTFRCQTCKSELSSCLHQVLFHFTLPTFTKCLIFQVHSLPFALGNLLCYVIHVLSPRDLKTVPGKLCHSSTFCQRQKIWSSIPDVAMVSPHW